MKRAPAFLAGFVVAACLVYGVACRMDLGAGIGDLADPAGAAATETARIDAAVPRAEAVAADEARPPAERAAAAADASEMKALRAEIDRLRAEIGSIPTPKGITLPELLAWLVGSGGLVSWVTKWMALRAALKRSREITEKWDKETPMTIEDAAELAPLLAQIRTQTPPPAPGA